MITARISIPPERLADFCRQHHIQKLSFFGSVLRDDFTPDSDIDVLVEFEPGFIPGLDFFTIQNKLSALLGRRVDLNTPGFLSPRFRDQVITEAKVLFATP